MTDLTVNPVNVVAGTNAEKIQGTAGATITAGQAVYRDTTTGRYSPADTDSATAGARNVEGIALHGASNGQPLMVQTGGDINLGATLTPGEVYVLSGAPGAICPRGDLAPGDYTAVIGVASSASNLKLDIVLGGAALT